MLFKQHLEIPMSTACCPEYGVLPENVDCFTPAVCSEVSRLYRLHQKKFTKRARLLEMAKPKHFKKPYVPICGCPFRNPVQIIHLEKSPERTRTEQLSLNSARRLLLFKKDRKHILSDMQKEHLNRLIRKYLYSLYGRLTNATPPVEPIPKPKWTKEEWKIHTKYLKKLARPKKPKLPPKEPRQQKPLSSMTRFKKLAVPRYHFEEVKPEWVFTPGMKYYKPSANINKISKPRVVNEEDMFNELPIRPPPGALKYKASPRVKELATAADRRMGESDLKENPFAISPNALKYKTSQRMQELAEPKEYENVHIRDNPQLISPAALKAVASPRIIELAKPKGS